MSEKQIKESFELFGNVKISDDPFVIKSSGSELGISTSFALAKVMNGSLEIQSEIGVRTTVTMKFESFDVDKSIMEIEMRRNEQQKDIQKPKKKKTVNFANNFDFKVAAETHQKSLNKIVKQ